MRRQIDKGDVWPRANANRMRPCDTVMPVSFQVVVW